MLNFRNNIKFILEWNYTSSSASIAIPADKLNYFSWISFPFRITYEKFNSEWKAVWREILECSNITSWNLIVSRAVEACPKSDYVNEYNQTAIALESGWIMEIRYTSASFNEFDRIFISDTRWANRPPSFYDDRYLQADFWEATNFWITAPSEAWAAALTIWKWTEYLTAHKQEQIIFNSWKIYRRIATSESTWWATFEMLDSINDQWITWVKAFLNDLWSHAVSRFWDWANCIALWNDATYNRIDTVGKHLKIVSPTITMAEERVEPFYWPLRKLLDPSFAFKFRKSDDNNLLQMWGDYVKVWDNIKFIKWYSSWWSANELKIWSRNEFSWILHWAMGHHLQVLWGDLNWAPEWTSNDGWWGLKFWNANPYLFMVWDTTQLWRDWGTTNIRGAMQINGVPFSPSWNTMRMKRYVWTFWGVTSITFTHSFWAFPIWITLLIKWQTWNTIYSKWGYTHADTSQSCVATYAPNPYYSTSKIWYWYSTWAITLQNVTANSFQLAYTTADADSLYEIEMFY